MSELLCRGSNRVTAAKWGVVSNRAVAGAGVDARVDGQQGQQLEAERVASWFAMMLR